MARQGSRMTNRARAAFLEVLRECANVSEACRRANISRNCAYDHKEADEEFRKAWEIAEAEAVDRLEKEAWRRAHDGTERPVFQTGKQVGVVREYSDRLMELLLKAHRPYRYKERVETQLASPTGGDAKLIIEYRDPTQKG